MADVLYSTDGEIFQYDSVEELMTTEDMDEYVVGTILFEAETYDIKPDFIAVQEILDIIESAWYNEGGENAVGFQPPAEAIEELESFLQQWQEKHAVAPFVGIKNVLPYYITQEDIDRVRGEDE
jgi:hypothetical protein